MTGAADRTESCRLCLRLRAPAARTLNGFALCADCLAGLYRPGDGHGVALRRRKAARK